VGVGVRVAGVMEDSFVRTGGGMPIVLVAEAVAVAVLDGVKMSTVMVGSSTMPVAVAEAVGVAEAVLVEVAMDVGVSVAVGGAGVCVGVLVGGVPVGV
jgi:hypothetical protein